MPESAADKRTRRRRLPMVLFIFLLLMFGLFGLHRARQSASFESYRTADVAQLLVSGAGFGAALTGFMVLLLRPRN